MRKFAISILLAVALTFCSVSFADSSVPFITFGTTDDGSVPFTDYAYSIPVGMCFDSEERYRCSYYLSNFGEQCIDGREFVLNDYYGVENEEIVASLLVYAYLNRNDKIYTEGNSYAVSYSDFSDLTRRHIGMSSIDFGSIHSARFALRGNSVIFDTGLANSIQNNYFTIVYAAEEEYGSYRVAFHIYRASPSYWQNAGFWFDKSVYRMTDDQAMHNRDFTQVAEGIAVLSPYKISSGYTYQLMEYHLMDVYL